MFSEAAQDATGGPGNRQRTSPLRLDEPAVQAPGGSGRFPGLPRDGGRADAVSCTQSAGAPESGGSGASAITHEHPRKSGPAMQILCGNSDRFASDDNYDRFDDVDNMVEFGLPTDEAQAVIEAIRHGLTHDTPLVQPLERALDSMTRAYQRASAETWRRERRQLAADLLDCARAAR
jgi:hypothetical protein